MLFTIVKNRNLYMYMYISVQDATSINYQLNLIAKPLYSVKNTDFTVAIL